MLQVASASLFGCCMCFTHMFQVHVLNVSSALDICCIQIFHILEVESHGGTARAPEDGRRRAKASRRAVLGPTVGVCGTPGVVWTGRARPRSICLPGPAHIEKEREEGVRGRSGGRKEEVRASRLAERERRGSGGRSSGRPPWVRVTEEARVAGCALLSRRPGASISQSRILD
jgi:hypothetical protein